MKPEGAGAGGILAKGLFGGNSDFGSVVTGLTLANGFAGVCSVDVVVLALAKGLEGFCSVDADMPNEVAGVDVVEGSLVNGFEPVDMVDPNEKEGNVDDENEGALIPPKSPLPFDGGG